jgi:hypothetical protein
MKNGTEPSTDATITANENRILIKAHENGCSIDTEYARRIAVLEQKK